MYASFLNHDPPFSWACIRKNLPDLNEKNGTIFPNLQAIHFKEVNSCRFFIQYGTFI